MRTEEQWCKQGLEVLLAPSSSSLSLAEFQEERMYFVPANTLSWDTRELDSALLKIRTALNSGFLFPVIVPLFLES